mmetsp:Transcript_458/g.1514  ORF Transcript_458/g.1514 Transcript_458/m.1514 type:complete len:224 (+) Transcript_458:452-1123(+)
MADKESEASSSRSRRTTTDGSGQPHFHIPRADETTGPEDERSAGLLVTCQGNGFPQCTRCSNGRLSSTAAIRAETGGSRIDAARRQSGPPPASTTSGGSSAPTAAIGSNSNSTSSWSSAPSSATSSSCSSPASGGDAASCEAKATAPHAAQAPAAARVLATGTASERSVRHVGTSFSSRRSPAQLLASNSFLWVLLGVAYVAARCSPEQLSPQRQHELFSFQR